MAIPGLPGFIIYQGNPCICPKRTPRFVRAVFDANQSTTKNWIIGSQSLSKRKMVGDLWVPVRLSPRKGKLCMVDSRSKTPKGHLL